MLVVDHHNWIRRGRFALLKDGKTFYVKTGQGFPLVLLHLFGGRSWWFSKVADKLSEDFTVYAVDIIGLGYSDTPRRDYTVEDLAAWITEFLDYHEIAKTHLVGTHGSSMASVNFATTYPERLEKLILDGPIPWTSDEGKKLYQERFRHHWLDQNERPKPVMEWEGNHFPGLPEPERTESRQRLADDWDPHANWWLMGLHNILEFCDRKNLHLIKAPTLLLYGEQDMLRGTESWMPGGERRMQEGINGSELVVIPGCGSFPAYEKPTEYTEAVRSFLLR